MSKQILVFHHNDLDGVVAAMMLAKRFGFTNCAFQSIGYNNQKYKIKEQFKKGNLDSAKKIFFVDFCPNEEQLIYLEENWKEKLRILDHHKTTAEKGLTKFETVTLKEKDLDQKATCGASMVYYEFLENTDKDSRALRELALLTRAYDTWTWKEDGIQKAKDLNDLYYILYKNDDASFISALLSRTLGDHFNFSELEKVFIKKATEDNLAYATLKAKHATVKNINGFKTAIVFAERCVNDIAEQIYLNDETIDISMIVNIDSGTASLRSRTNKVDVSQIAKTLGGGGHKSAAGFILDPSVKENLLKDIKWAMA